MSTVQQCDSKPTFTDARMKVIYFKWKHLISVTSFVAMAFIVYTYTVVRRHNASDDKETRLQQIAMQLSNDLLYQTGNYSLRTWDVDDVTWLESESQVKQASDNSRQIERTAEYCNLMHNLSYGQEGRLKKYKLLNVHVIIRHGDRSPIFSIPNLPTPNLSCDLTEDFPDVKEKYLQFIGNTVKHAHLKTFPSQARCDGSQLTPRGFLQHAKVGMHLAQVYINKRNLFGEDFNQTDWKNSVYVRTTHYSRTFQSAWAFLFGFFSNVTNANNINVITDTYATNLCSPQLARVSCSCPMLKNLETTLTKEHHKVVRNHTLYKQAKKTVSEVLGIPVSAVPWIGANLDVLMAYTCHNQKLPCISKTKKCFTEKQVNDMWLASDSVNKAEVTSDTKLKSSDMMMYPLMREIANRYVNITKGLCEQRVVLYSGHDKTLSPLLVAMGISDGKWPPYAARLVMELYQSRANSKQYYLRVIYNGKTVTKQLRFCDNSLCPLKRYLDFVFQKQLGRYKAKYKEICSV